jgi:hypothetical protein
VTTQRPEKGELLREGLLYRRVSNAAVRWENGRPTARAFDPQEGDKGISFFRQDLLHPDPEIAKPMVLEGHTDYGVIQIAAERFFAERDDWAKEIPQVQEIKIPYDPDPDDARCGHAHYYFVEVTEQQRLQRYIKEILVGVASTIEPATNLGGGKRF